MVRNHVLPLPLLCRFAEHRRQLTEPPIPGYRGFVPRIGVTELGLGARYHETTDNGLNAFYTQLDERSQRLGNGRTTFGAQRVEPITINRFDLMMA